MYINLVTVNTRVLPTYMLVYIYIYIYIHTLTVDACMQMAVQWLGKTCGGNPITLLNALDVHTSSEQTERALKVCMHVYEYAFVNK